MNIHHHRNHWPNKVVYIYYCYSSHHMYSSHLPITIFSPNILNKYKKKKNTHRTFSGKYTVQSRYEKLYLSSHSWICDTFKSMWLMDFHIKLDRRAKHILSFLTIDFFCILHDNKLYAMNVWGTILHPRVFWHKLWQ